MNSGSSIMKLSSDAANRELFALTDEQILGIEEGEKGGDEAELRSFDSEPRKARLSAQDDRLDSETLNAEGAAQAGGQQSQKARTGVPFDAAQGKSVPVEAPKWLAERMKDPWHGDEARELWEGAQKAEREAGEYRELFATPADARALKELYPGGVAEAKSAAERARQLEEIDAAYFCATGRAPAELSAGRTQLAKRLMEQDPATFREMVMAGVELLERASGEQGKSRSTALARGDRQAVAGESKSELDGKDKSTNRASVSERERQRIGDGAGVDGKLAREYAEFEKSANAELERSVGNTISRTMEQALPNLSRMASGQSGERLSDRLRSSVREEIDAALKSDAQLGEQVSKVLAGRRFDDASRAQVVRLIDARAQQLVPAAVRRVVSNWTQTAMAARRGEVSSREEKASNSSARQENESVNAASKKPAPRSTPTDRPKPSGRGRVNYGKWSDEEILGM